MLRCITLLETPTSGRIVIGGQGIALRCHGKPASRKQIKKGALTSELDPELASEVLNVIRDLAAEGRTMIRVPHEMKYACEVANHAIDLHNSMVEEEGPPDALFGSPTSDRLKRFLKSVD